MDEAFLTESLDPTTPIWRHPKIGLTPTRTGICAVAGMSEVRQDVVFVDEDDVTDPNNPVDTPEAPNPRSITITDTQVPERAPSTRGRSSR